MKEAADKLRVKLSKKDVAKSAKRNPNPYVDTVYDFIYSKKSGHTDAAMRTSFRESRQAALADKQVVKKMLKPQSFIYLDVPNQKMQ